jgi:hypothetical protein
MIRYLKIWLAHRRLQKLVERQRDSYECRRYRERRAAALKGLGRA